MRTKQTEYSFLKWKKRRAQRNVFSNIETQWAVTEPSKLVRDPEMHEYVQKIANKLEIAKEVGKR